MRDVTIRQEYFEWMYGLVCTNRYSSHISYRKLLAYLHSVGFRYSIKRDVNRAEDGKDLRYRYAIEHGYENSANVIVDILGGSCSVLEMMVALALRCEETIMDDPQIGNRTAQWFWGMIVSLGLGDMIDSRFDRDYVADRIDIFLNREYDPDGRGGLFTIRHCNRDLRDVEIWTQMCWYLG